MHGCRYLSIDPIPVAAIFARTSSERFARSNSCE